MHFTAEEDGVVAAHEVDTSDEGKEERLQTLGGLDITFLRL